ncbi:MAG TPA: DUF11 domain-containing protein [Dehalococcoidia bacterium]|nr:DUF11 domain-containing protein [Dehalococcoidia bacterium]
MKSGNDNWIEAEVGTTVELGDTLRAGDDSRAVVTFFEGSTIELEAGTEVEVTELGIAEDTGSTIIRLKQVIGNTVSRVKKLADADSVYEIETPTAIAAVRGSIMFVRVREDGATAVGNSEGSVSVTAQGQEVLLPEGTYSNVEPGQAPTAPKQGIGPPALAISKTADREIACVGDTITYTYLVTNTGGTPLSDISITDDKTGSTTDNGSAVLDIGQTWEFSATYMVSAADPNILVNTAVVSGTDAEGQVVTAQASASVTIIRAGMLLTKTAEPAEVYDDDTVTYTYVVTNNGNTALSGITVSDDRIWEIGSGGELNIGESWELTATYTVSEEDNSPLENTATASGSDALGNIVSVEASASVTILRPDIALTKTADADEVEEGDTITYTYTVTNPGNVPLSGIAVNDNRAGATAYQSGDSDGDGKLDVGEAWVFTATYTVSYSDSSPIINVATASGSDSLGRVVTAEATASVDITSDEQPGPGFTVTITSPQDGATVITRTLTVTGMVNDLAVTVATININGSSHAISVSGGYFSTEENVSAGPNTITVSATNVQLVTASDTVTIDVQIPTYGIRIELTWDKDDTDMDAHLVRPGGEVWDGTDDCHWLNPNPDWGIIEVSNDNPSLDQDNRVGLGPENITLQQPYEEGTYQLFIHYFDDHDNGSSVATVRIWIDDVLVAIFVKEMAPDELWECALIDWPSGEVSPGNGS